MKKLSISLIALIFATPSFATGIAASAQSADCDNDVLGTYTGPASLSANWTANTINLNFYDGEDKLSSGTCTYDGGIELPEDPTKTGYEFDGWKVRRAAAAPSQPQQLSTNNICTNGIDYGYINDSSGEYGESSNNTDKYDLTEEQTWAAEFSYGTVKGIASCNTTPGSDWQYNGIFTTATSDAHNQSSIGPYCWCRVTSYTPLNGSEQPISSSSWVYHNAGDMDDCAYDCAGNCAAAVVNNRGVNNRPLFRGPVFGVDGADSCE
jgi:uncharacterized repeat protein (TIGR02543 family)